MPKIKKTWKFMPENNILKEELSTNLGISDVIAQVLVNRGIIDKSTAKDFLFGGQENLNDPYLLKNMEKAIARIVKAITAKQKISVYGDYDVDGITSSALLYKVLKELGGIVEYYIPDRQHEGYGLNSTALTMLVASGTELLITVDCGISATKEVNDIAKKLDIIITDHHEPPDVLPMAYAIINPKQKDCPYPEKNLAGVGVAFKLSQALSQYYYGHDTQFSAYLDIVAIGTVADIVSLTGENRTLVKLGICEIANTKNIGLKALIEICRIDPTKIDTGKIGFAIAPRLNAAGRISRADFGVELLITDSIDRAEELASYLENENSQRQNVEKEIQVAAEAVVAGLDLSITKVLVVFGEGWHPGVIGIVASRLVEKYYRPVVMISIKDGIGKASCRSIPAFDIYAALNQCSDLLLQFGGHRQAAGFSVLPDHIDELRVRLNHIANTTLTQSDYVPVLMIDSLVSLDEINTGFLEQLGCLEPYGMGNHSPIFACKDVEVKDIRTIGQDAQHLKLKVSKKNITNEVVAWKMGGLAESIQFKENVDLAFFPEINEWQGQQKIQLRAYDVRKIEITELEKLYALHSNRHHSSLEDCYLDSSQLLSDQELQKNYIVKDHRNSEDKFKYLLDIVRSQEKALIFVNTPQESFELARKLRHCLGAYKDQIGFYHSGLGSEWQEKVENWLKEDILTVVCTTLFSKKISTIDNIRHILIYSLPFNMQSFIQQCSLIGCDRNNSYIHLLFNQEDLKDNQLLLQELRPDRLIVGQIYVVLKYCEDTVMDSEVVATAWKKYQVVISESSVSAAITILEELKLIQCELVDSKRRIVILPAPKEKLEIEQSYTFQQGILQKKEIAAFAEEIMKLPGDEMLLQVKHGD